MKATKCPVCKGTGLLGDQPCACYAGYFYEPESEDYVEVTEEHPDRKLGTCTWCLPWKDFASIIGEAIGNDLAKGRRVFLSMVHLKGD